jgi:hypothetical protein
MQIIQCRSEDPEDVAEAHEDFLLTLLEGAESAQRSWDCVQLTLLGHNGTVRGSTLRTRRPFWYPQDEDEAYARTPEHFDDTSEVVVQLEVPALEQEDDDDDDEEPSAAAQDERDARHLELRLLYLRRALKQKALSSIRNGYFETARYGIQWTTENEVYYECDFTPLEGKRLPRPPQPEGSVGVMSRLVYAQHSTLSRQIDHLTFDDGLLTRVRLFGGEVTDRTIALLDDVENVSLTCATLERLCLERTAISEKGFAQLRRLLPKVKLEIIG